MYVCMYVSVWASWRSYTYIAGPPELGDPEKLTFRWNHAYLVQNCAKNAIQTRKFWEMPMTGCMTLGSKNALGFSAYTGPKIVIGLRP